MTLLKFLCYKNFLFYSKLLHQPILEFAPRFFGMMEFCTADCELTRYPHCFHSNLPAFVDGVEMIFPSMSAWSQTSWRVCKKRYLTLVFNPRLAVIAEVRLFQRFSFIDFLSLSTADASVFSGGCSDSPYLLCFYMIYVVQLDVPSAHHILFCLTNYGATWPLLVAFPVGREAFPGAITV